MTNSTIHACATANDEGSTSEHEKIALSQKSKSQSKVEFSATPTSLKTPFGRHVDHHSALLWSNPGRGACSSLINEGVGC